MKVSEHIQIGKKSIRLLFSLSRAYTICLFLGSLIRAILPYVPICFSARLVDALCAGRPVQVLVLYVSLTVGIVFLLSLLDTWISSRRFIVENVLYRNENWKY